MPKVPTEQAPAGAVDAAVFRLLEGVQSLGIAVPVPYTEDFWPTWALEQSIADDDDKQFAYLCHLIELLALDVTLFYGALERDRPDTSVPEALFALVHATPEQRIKAFLLTNGVTEIEVGDA